MIRRARAEDVDATARIYEALMDREEAGQGATNWKRDVYPTRETARRAQEAGWLYVKEDGAGGICASMILNHEQPPCYRDADWQVTAAPENVLVLHTLCVDPAGHSRPRAPFRRPASRSPPPPPHSHQTRRTWQSVDGSFFHRPRPAASSLIHPVSFLLTGLLRLCVAHQRHRQAF